MRMRSSLPLVVAAAALLAPATTARAQTFPAENGWVAFPCGLGAMIDPPRDQGGAIQERDVVGDPRWPAGYRAVDSQYLYLRLRIDDSPALGGAGNLRSASWGFAFSLDGDAANYEVLVTLEGDTRTVAVFRNGSTTMPDSPADPADAPPLATFPAGTHARTSMAGDGSNFNGSRDHFVDLAVPWSALNMAGLEVDRQIVVWAGTSTAADRLNADIACHDATGGGAPDLARSGTAMTTAGSTTPPPMGGAGGSGGAPGTGGAAGLSLEGGPSCRFGGGAAGSGAMVVVMALVAVAVRRRRR